MQCFNPLAITVKNQVFKVPCGKCMGCRIARRREWSVRIMHELSTWKNCGFFLTLTYDDENMPDNQSLNKPDLQLFWKRLRKSIEPKKIRYYACGEYGENTKRPHYHAIVFGLSLSEINTVMNSKGRMISKDIEKLWKYGFNVVGTVTTDSAQYVAGYIEKKLNGPEGQLEYAQTGRVAPFSAASLGIGRQYADENSQQIKQQLNITINGKNVGIPRYYKKRLEIDTEQIKERLKQKEHKLHDIYEKVYNNGGLDAVDKRMRDTAQYRYEMIKSRLQSKKRILENSGDISPESPSEAR